MGTLILSTIQKERLNECLNKKVYGLSEGMIRKLDKSIFNIKFGDFLYLKLKKPESIIIGPFKIKPIPSQIKFIQNKSMWYKIGKDYINSNLPWWVIEGFSWLIFFDLVNDKILYSKESELKSKNLFTPDYGILQTGKDIDLLNFIKTHGIKYIDF